MITTDKHELRIDRRGVSAIAENLQKTLGITRSAAIDAIAKAAGYAAGNALMGTLKNAEENPKDLQIAAADVPENPSDGGERAGWRYDITYSILTKHEIEDGLDVSDLMKLGEMGDIIVQWSEPRKVATPLSYDQLETAASSDVFQSDVSYLMGHDEDDDV